MLINRLTDFQDAVQEQRNLHESRRHLNRPVYVTVSGIK